MCDNECGKLNLLQYVSTEELEAEIKRRADLAEAELKQRKELAIAAKDAFMKREWPRHHISNWLQIVNFMVATIGVSFMASRIDNFSREFFGSFSEPVTLLVIVILFVVLYSPSCFLLQKEARLSRRFQQEYPEHYSAL